MIKIGSLFSGIGGFELGLERAIPDSKTIWQVEQDRYCQKVLKKHWPDAKIYNDVRDITAEKVEPVDLICGGFPCQDISVAGKGEGLDGKKSGLWWEMHRIIRSLRPRVVVLENVAAITIRGGLSVIGSLTEIGYVCEWSIISARERGASHLRERWFCVAYSSSERCLERQGLEKKIQQTRHKGLQREESKKSNLSESIYSSNNVAYPNNRPKSEEIQSGRKEYAMCNNGTSTNSHSYWKRHEAPSPICRVDDGIPNRVDRIRALGNAIVPQCSEYVGRLIHKSGVLYG